MSKKMRKRLELREQLDDVMRSDGTVLDMASNCIHGVKLLGWDSKNSNRRYLPEGVNPNLYENVAVNVDHPTEEEKKLPRPLAARFGWTANAEKRADGIYGDLYYNPKHHLAESFLWWVQNKPDKIGLSHNAFGDVWEGEDGEIVENVDEVRSVDLVSDPATTKGIFEAYHGPQGRGGGISNPGGVSLPSQPPDEEEDNESDYYDAEGFPRTPSMVAKIRNDRKDDYGEQRAMNREGKASASPMDSDRPEDLFDEEGNEHDPETVAKIRGGRKVKESGEYSAFSQVPVGHTFGYGGEVHKKVSDTHAKGVPSGKLNAFKSTTPVNDVRPPEKKVEEAIPNDDELARQAEEEISNAKPKKMGARQTRDAKTEIAQADPYKPQKSVNPKATPEGEKTMPVKEVPAPHESKIAHAPVMEDDEEELPLPPGGGPDEEMPPGGGDGMPPGGDADGDEGGETGAMPAEDGGMEDQDEEQGPPVDQLDLTDEMMASIEKVARSTIPTESKKKRIIAILKGMMHDAMEALVPKDLPAAKKLLRESRLLPRKATRLVLRKLEDYEVKEAAAKNMKKAANLCESLKLPVDARSDLFMEDLANCKDENRQRKMIEDRRGLVGIARSTRPRSAAGDPLLLGGNKKNVKEGTSSKVKTEKEVQAEQDAALAEFEAEALGISN